MLATDLLVHPEELVVCRQAGGEHDEVARQFLNLVLLLDLWCERILDVGWQTTSSSRTYRAPTTFPK